MICPKDNSPCCDDICYGSGCVQMDGYPMLKICDFCGGTIDEEIPDCGTCSCDNDVLGILEGVPDDVFQRLTDAGHNATSALYQLAQAFHDTADKAHILIFESRELSNNPEIDAVIKPKIVKPFYRHRERW